jgi:hypothetical protein
VFTNTFGIATPDCSFQQKASGFAGNAPSTADAGGAICWKAPVVPVIAASAAVARRSVQRERALGRVTAFDSGCMASSFQEGVWCDRSRGRR